MNCSSSKSMEIKMKIQTKFINFFAFNLEYFAKNTFFFKEEKQTKYDNLFTLKEMPLDKPKTNTY